MLYRTLKNSMLKLNFAPTTETVLPGINRFRVWTHPDICSHSLAALSLERLYLAALDQPLPMNLTDGAVDIEFDNFLGLATNTVEFTSIKKINLCLITNTVEITAVTGHREPLQVALTFATPMSADSFFTRLWHRLGDNLTLKPYSQLTGNVIRIPLSVLLGALVITALLVGTLSVMEDISPDLGAGLSWQVVCALGGIATAIGQVWLYRRLTTPPVNLELIRV
jgi:hypothetical protein